MALQNCMVPKEGEQQCSLYVAKSAWYFQKSFAPATAGFSFILAQAIDLTCQIRERLQSFNNFRIFNLAKSKLEITKCESCNLSRYWLTANEPPKPESLILV